MPISNKEHKARVSKRVKQSTDAMTMRLTRDTGVKWKEAKDKYEKGNGPLKKYKKK